MTTRRQPRNLLYTGDNLYILNGMNSDSVDLIYLDPPFNSKRSFSAPIGSRAAGASFKDMWTWKDVDEAYLERMEFKLLTYLHTVCLPLIVHDELLAVAEQAEPLQPEASSFSSAINNS